MTEFWHARISLQKTTRPVCKNSVGNSKLVKNDYEKCLCLGLLHSHFLGARWVRGVPPLRVQIKRDALVVKAEVILSTHIFSQGKFNKKCSQCFKIFFNARRFVEHRKHHRVHNLNSSPSTKSPFSGYFGYILRRYNTITLIPENYHPLTSGSGKVDVGVNTDIDGTEDKVELYDSQKSCIFYTYTNDRNNPKTADEMFKDLKRRRCTLMWMKDQDSDYFCSDTESDTEEKNTQNLVAIENRTTENKKIQVDTHKKPKELNMCVLYLYKNILQMHCALTHIDIKTPQRANLDELFIQMELSFSHQSESCPPFIPNAKQRRKMLLRKVLERMVEVDITTHNLLKFIIQNKLQGWNEPEFLSFKVLFFSKLKD
ncbi:hypothetical protein TNIN_279681 [Trichonephila inaurata madagascariensis]|uniref:C2H2-type domain-containing protein n=1 Tax=Trichonephila inaurata madagascariensis TaxID=2747483 RepID=A0A8X6MGN3_9ARAC|nr:hypothetical protein TNIN_279681 [Trichonephila inaurata madagascariensis]